MLWWFAVFIAKWNDAAWKMTCCKTWKWRWTAHYRLASIICSPITTAMFLAVQALLLNTAINNNNKKTLRKIYFLSSSFPVCISLAEATELWVFEYCFVEKDVRFIQRWWEAHNKVSRTHLNQNLLESCICSRSNHSICRSNSKFVCFYSTFLSVFGHFI